VADPATAPIRDRLGRSPTTQPKTSAAQLGAPRIDCLILQMGWVPRSIPTAFRVRKNGARFQSNSIVLSVDWLSAASPRAEIPYQAQTRFKAADQLGFLTGPEGPDELLKQHIHLVSTIIGTDHKVDHFETLPPLARRCERDRPGEIRISRAVWSSPQKEVSTCVMPATDSVG